MLARLSLHKPCRLACRSEPWGLLDPFCADLLMFVHRFCADDVISGLALPLPLPATGAAVAEAAAVAKATCRPLGPCLGDLGRWALGAQGVWGVWPVALDPATPPVRAVTRTVKVAVTVVRALGITAAGMITFVVMLMIVHLLPTVILIQYTHAYTSACSCAHACDTRSYMCTRTRTHLYTVLLRQSPRAAHLRAAQ